MNSNRKEKLSHHVAMVAHFLDDNKTKTSHVVKCWRNFLELHPKVKKKKKKIFFVVFTYSRKKVHEIRKFCVTVVQRLLRNLQECDARAALLFCYYSFAVSCWLRRRRWFSSLTL